MMDRTKFLKLLGLGSVAANLPISAIHSQNPLLKPKSLKKGDTVGLISPSSRLPEYDLYNKIANTIESLSYKVKEGKNARNNYGYLGGTDKERASDLNEMFDDDDVKAIMPFRGGWGANRILNLLDYDLIRDNPKILVGFSDITSLLLAIYEKTGLVTFHGPVGKSDWTDYTKNHFENILSGFQQNKIQTTAKDVCETCDKLNTIESGKARGRLLGGNLSVLTAMLGSNYVPDMKGSILFVEDVGEDIYRIDRMLTQLKINGILGELSGFIFGQCTDCEKSHSYSLSLNQLFDDHIKPLGIPAFSGAMVGHISDMLTLPVGLEVEMNAATGIVSFNESPFSD